MFLAASGLMSGLEYAVLGEWFKWLTTSHDVNVDLIGKATGPIFIKHLKSNVYVTLNAIGSFLCNLCFHWLNQIFIT